MQKRCSGCMKLKKQSPICEFCGFDEKRHVFSHQLPRETILKEQYFVGKVLGQGGFGITYLGWDLNLEIPVAIKEYYPSGQATRECTHSLNVTSTTENGSVLYQNNKERFLREARALARLRDVLGVVRVLNFFEENNTAYIIMEYVEGINLRSYVRHKGGKLTVGETLSLLQPIIEVLRKVHGEEMIHRDISPDNIMVQKNGVATLLDFGAVREVLNADAELMLQQSTETILKHGFAPMEQYRSRGSLGPWTDIYALCATIYYCLAGNVPPDAPGRLFQDTDISWKEFSELSERQIKTLEKGMEILPKDRIASIDELYKGLYGSGRESQKEACVATLEPKVMALQQANTVSTVAGKESGYFEAPIQGQETVLVKGVFQNQQLARIAIEDNQAYRRKEPKQREPKLGRSKLLIITIVFVLLIVAGILFWRSEFGKNRQETTDEVRQNTLSQMQGSPTSSSLRVEENDPIDYLKINTVYESGTMLDAESLGLKAVHESGRVEMITDDFSCSPSVLYETGTQMITITYGEIKRVFDVEVVDFYLLEAKIETLSGTDYNENGRVGWVLKLNMAYYGNSLKKSFESDVVTTDDYLAGWSKESWEAAKNGRSAHWGFKGGFASDHDHYIGQFVILPDDPSFAGEYSATACIREREKTVTFSLVHNGDYETGTGWSIENVKWT